MKKRIACFMLTLIMLVSLVPTAAISASAASYTVSEAAITVLKKMTTLKTTCYQVGSDSSEFRIGYGTVCSVGKHKVEREKQADGTYKVTIEYLDPKGKVIKNSKGEDVHEHRITEKQADAMLRESLAELDKKVDSFASSNSISLSQRQHDALVVLTYGVGSAWMSGTSAVKTALTSGASASELLAAIAKTYSVDPTNESNAIVARAKIVVNMYANGIYSNVVPSIYSVVTYDARGGVVAGQQTYQFYFDASKSTGHPVVATMNGQTFTGWYLLENGNYRLVEKLNGDCAGKTLYAGWQKADDIAAGQIIDVKDLFAKNGTIQTYEDPSQDGTSLELREEYTRINISATFVDGDGCKWVRIGSGKTVYSDSEEAWVKSDKYAKRWVQLKADVSNPVEDVTSVFSISELKSRDLYNAPNTSSDSKKNLDKAYTHVKTSGLYIDSNGVRWAQIGADDDLVVSKDGKTYKKDTDANGKWVIVKTGSNGGVTVGAAAGAIAKATVTYSGGYVKVRSGAGTGYPIVGSVRNGETLDVFEIKTANGHKWGRITAGWFCLTYANVIMLGNNSDPDITSEGALAYTYSASINADSVEAYVTSGGNSNYAPYYEQLTNGTAVTVTNMTINNGNVWVKIRWQATYNKVSGGKETTKETTASGWVMLTSNTLSLSSEPVMLSGSVRYTVAADEITVRAAAGSGEKAVFKMNKGVEFTVSELEIVGEELWGRTAELQIVNGMYQGKEDANSPTYKDGWVNLSNKYVSRTSLPTVEGGSGNALSPIGKTATIVNTDSVRVRICAGLYGRQVGTLSRGTTANILEIEDGWYNLDIDVDNDPETGSWVFEDYVQVNDGYVASNNGSNTTTVNNPDGTKTTTTTVGKGVVANTYSGVNFRSGAGIGYALLGKLLPGTAVDILETKNAGAAKWGRVKYDGKEGWVCMDYITMISSTTTTTTTTTGNGTGVKDFGTIDKTTTTAVYTGMINSGSGDTKIMKAAVVADGEEGKYVWATPKHNQDPSYAIRKLTPGEAVTIYELMEVTEVVWIDNKTGDIVDDAEDDFDKQTIDDHGTADDSFSKETLVSYWARTSDGYIYNPQACITLDALDEQVHTLTGSDTLKVRDAANGGEIGELEKGDQVIVTSLEIKNDKVWGKIEYGGEDSNNGIGEGWVRLDYMSEGAYYEEKVTETQTNTTNNGGSTGTNGNTGNVGNTGNTGGLVTNGSGYRYTGKVINTNEVNVRQTASQTAPLTTKLKNGASLVIYETTISENMAWGRCDAGWVYLYYVDLTPVESGLVDARVVYNDNTIIYSDANGSTTVGTYARMSVIDIYEIAGKMARTDQGWVNTDNLL